MLTLFCRVTVPAAPSYAVGVDDIGIHFWLIVRLLMQGASVVQSRGGADDWADVSSTSSASTTFLPHPAVQVSHTAGTVHMTCLILMCTTVLHCTRLLCYDLYVCDNNLVCNLCSAMYQSMSKQA